MPRWSFGRPLAVHFGARRSLHSIFKQVPQPTPKLPPSLATAEPTALVEPIPAVNCPAPRTQLAWIPLGGPDPIPFPGTLAPAAPPAAPAKPREPPGPGPLFPPRRAPAASGPLCSHHPQTLLSKRQKLVDLPLKSSSRKKSGSRALSPNPDRRLSAMSRVAEGPPARGAGSIPRAHARSLPEPCYPPLVTIATTWPAGAVTMVTKEAESGYYGCRDALDLGLLGLTQ